MELFLEMVDLIWQYQIVIRILNEFHGNRDLSIYKSFEIKNKDLALYFTAPREETLRLSSAQIMVILNLSKKVHCITTGRDMYTILIWKISLYKIKEQFYSM